MTAAKVIDGKLSGDSAPERTRAWIRENVKPFPPAEPLDPAKPPKSARERVVRGFCYPIVLSPVAAAAILLQMNLLLDAKLVDEETWWAVVGLLCLKELSDPLCI